MTKQQQHILKPPVNRKLFSEKDISPKAKQARPSGKAGPEPTKAWVMKSFGKKHEEPPTQTVSKNSREDSKEEPRKRDFKPASWYRDTNVEKTKAASDPGKPTNRRSLSGDKLNSKLAVQGKKISYLICVAR